MEPGTAGVIGGIAGMVAGLVGGMIGTYASVSRARSPRERSFMVKAAAVCWVVVAAFLAGILLLPSPYRWLLWIPYAVLLPLGVVAMNRKVARIRGGEEGHA